MRRVRRGRRAKSLAGHGRTPPAVIYSWVVSRGGGRWGSRSGAGRRRIPAGPRWSSRTAPSARRASCSPGSTSSPTPSGGWGCGPVTASPCCCPTAAPRWRSTWPRCRAAGTTPRSTGISPRRRSPTSWPTARPRRSSCTNGTRRPGPRPRTWPGCPPAPGSATARSRGSLPSRTCWPGSPSPCPRTGWRVRPCTTPPAPPAGPRACAGTCPGCDPDDAAETTTALLQIFGVPPGQPHVHLVTSPNYHTAVTLFGGAAIHLGHTLVYMDGWDSETALACVQRYRVTSTHMVPTQFKRMLSLPEATRRRYDLSSMRWIIHAAAPVPGAAQAGHAGLVGAAGVRVLRGHRRRRHPGHPAGLAGPPGHGGPAVADERDHDR